MVKLLSLLKLRRQFNYYLNSKIFTLIYLILLILFYILLNTLDKINYLEEGLIYLKIFIIIFIMFYMFYLNNSKLYEFSLFFSFYRTKLAKIYFINYLEYSIISTTFLYFIFTIKAYFTIPYYKFNYNLLFMLLYYFSLLIMLNAIINLFCENKLGLIIIFFFNLVLLFITLGVNNIFLPNIYYDGDYYFICSSKYLYLYLILGILLYFIIFNLKERR